MFPLSNWPVSFVCFEPCLFRTFHDTCVDKKNIVFIQYSGSVQSNTCLEATHFVSMCGLPDPLPPTNPLFVYNTCPAEKFQQEPEFAHMCGTTKRYTESPEESYLVRSRGSFMWKLSSKLYPNNMVTSLNSFVRFVAILLALSQFVCLSLSDRCLWAEA